MAESAKDLLGKLLEDLGAIAKTETVIGKEFTVGGVTLIPVSKVSLGVGAGGGTDKARGDREGCGGGGGVCVTPVAFIVVREGQVSFHGIRKGGSLDTLIENLPALDKILHKVSKKQRKQEGEETPEPEAAEEPPEG